MALYYPPYNNSPIYVEQNFINPNTPQTDGSGGGITEEFLNTNYLKFPNSQGVENFGFKELQLTSSNVGETATLFINPDGGQDVVLETSQTDGSLTIQTPTQNIIISPSIGITFADGTIQDTAYSDITSVHVDQDNTFEAGFTQTFNGPVILNGDTNGITAPLGDNSTLLATTEFVIANTDLSNYAQKTLATLQTFTGPITFNQSPTAIGLSLLNDSLDYLIQPRTNYGLVVVNNGGNSALSLSDGGSKVASITCTASQIFDFNGASLEDISSINIGSQSIYANFSTNQINGITTISNNNVNGGFTFTVNGGPIPTICNMLGTGFYIYNTLDMNNNGIANANLTSTCTTPTQSSGTSNTSLASTEFVSTALTNILGANNIWDGINTWNSNVGNQTAFIYPYGISNVWNILPSPGGGNGDCDVIANTGTGLTNNAYSIYCVGSDTDGATIATLTPQLRLSNNGFPMQIKDGIGIPTGKTYAVNGVNILNNTNLLGTPTLATSPTYPDDSTKIATTAFVVDAINAIPASVSPYFVSQIITTVGVTAPTGNWVFCNGQSLNAVVYPIYQNLYNNIGTSYGGTDNSNFNVPNFQGRGMAGDTTFSGIASINGSTQGGAPSFLLTNAPNHYHTNSINNATFYNGYSQATNNMSGSYVVNQNSTLTPVTNAGGVNIGNPGGETIPTQSPFIAVYYWIYAG